MFQLLCWLGIKSRLCVDTMPWASSIDSRRVDCVEMRSGHFFFYSPQSQSTPHPSIPKASITDGITHIATNQFYVDERQIHLHFSFKSFFPDPCFLLVWMMTEQLLWRNGPSWSRYLWHYSGRAMGWTLEGTAESFGRDQQANWSGKLWGQH